MSSSHAETAPTRPNYPAGFRARRGLNWGSLGLLYASFYMCRYNFRWASPDMRKEFGFDYTDIALIGSCWAGAYGVGQLVNGLFTDRIGGKIGMLIGAIGVIIANLAFGASSTIGSFSTFCAIWILNGYMQSFGAPGMVKINAAWFTRAERGTFAGIFGLVIQSGQIGITKLAPALLSGFTLAMWTVQPLHWRWLFWVPTIFVAILATASFFLAKETPEEAGFPNVHPGETAQTADSVKVTLKESFVTIAKHPLVWFYAAAYACTGAVRHGADQFAILYFVDHLKLDRHAPEMDWTLLLMPLFAVVGSFSSGFISDRFFGSRRAPVAMSLYFMETAAILLAVLLMEVCGFRSILLSCFFLVVISLTANSTHSIVGTAAPMDIGGRRMAGFALGVIDSFQYFGMFIALPIMGYLLDKYGWGTWFPAMAGFGLLGGIAMMAVSRRQKRLAVSGG